MDFPLIFDGFFDDFPLISHQCSIVPSVRAADVRDEVRQEGEQTPGGGQLEADDRQRDAIRDAHHHGDELVSARFGPIFKAFGLKTPSKRPFLARFRAISGRF